MFGLAASQRLKSDVFPIDLCVNHEDPEMGAFRLIESRARLGVCEALQTEMETRACLVGLKCGGTTSTILTLSARSFFRAGLSILRADAPSIPILRGLREIRPRSAGGRSTYAPIVTSDSATRLTTSFGISQLGDRTAINSVL